ncbi:MAG: hypothetical protein V1729_06210 [Candidatus Woesearchaeota archaeon]
MKHVNLGIVVLVVLLLAVPAMAATLHGSIYDIELNELTDVIVEIDSEPMQRQVAKDGQYSFELNPGQYLLTANYTDTFSTYAVEEDITIKEEGDYNYDLFMFPDLDVDYEELIGTQGLDELSGTVFVDTRINWNLLLIIVVLAVIVVLVTAYFVIGHLKKREEVQELKEVDKLEAAIKGEPVSEAKSKPLSVEPDQFMTDVLEVIRSEGGRTTQKEIRKHIPLSEAKISLIISELEHKKIVHKVKKGRGNIIILNKE